MLTLESLAKDYGATKALRGVSCSLIPRNVYGLIGVNGSGKSTMMKIIAGAEQPTRGTMTLDGQRYRPRNIGHANRLGIGLVPQELPIVPQMSVADNLFVGRWPSVAGLVRPAALRQMALSALAAVGATVEPHAVAGELTLGERQLVVIAKILSTNPRMLLLDEPTSALTGGDVVRLRQTVRQVADQGRTVVIVSQRLEDVFGLCDHLLILRNGELIASSPSKELDSDRAISLMLDGRAARDDAASSGRPARHHAVQEHDADGLYLKDLRVEDRTSRITLRVHKGEIVGLAGLPASGTSELLRGVFGALRTTSQDVRVMGEPFTPSGPSAAIGHGVAYISGDRQIEGLVEESSVATNIGMVRGRRAVGGPRRLRRMRREALEQIRLLSIRPGDPDQEVGALSGGNQQKVLVARWLLTAPRLWLLDDATRGVDVGARRDIHDVVRRSARESGSVALVVSSDLLELFELCQRIVVFRAGAVVADLEASRTTPVEIEALSTGSTVRCAS